MNFKRLFTILILLIIVSISAFSQVFSRSLYHEVGILENGVAYVMFTGGYKCMLSFEPDSNISITTDEYLGTKDMNIHYAFSKGDQEANGDFIAPSSPSGHYTLIPLEELTDFKKNVLNYENLIITIEKENGEYLVVPFPLNDITEVIIYLGY